MDWKYPGELRTRFKYLRTRFKEWWYLDKILERSEWPSSLHCSLHIHLFFSTLLHWAWWWPSSLQLWWWRNGWFCTLYNWSRNMSWHLFLNSCNFTTLTFKDTAQFTACSLKTLWQYDNSSNKLLHSVKNTTHDLPELVMLGSMALAERWRYKVRSHLS